MEKEIKKFYRYDLRHNVSIKFGESIKIVLTVFYLVKETSKGYWIDATLLNHYLPDYRLSNLKLYCKWVSKTSVKRLAYPTKREAMISLLKRTERRYKYVERDYDFVKLGLDLIKRVMKQKDTLQSCKDRTEVMSIPIGLGKIKRNET